MIRSVTIFRNMRCVCSCVLFVSNMSNIDFNSSTNAITDNNLLAKDIDQYYKIEINEEDSLPPKVGTHFTDWAV